MPNTTRSPHLECMTAVGVMLATAVLALGSAHGEESLKGLLPRLAPLEPREALESFRIDDGFRIELVAAEPNVVDPIALAFDERGRLYVCEDIDYPYPAAEGKRPLGRVRLLEDANGDGRYERSTIFAKHVHWPSGIV